MSVPRWPGGGSPTARSLAPSAPRDLDELPLGEHGVEPLGFEECSLRRKSQAVRAFEEVPGARDTFRLVHDTFHHHLAGEPQMFPERTGLAHISGVTDPTLAIADMRDAHRVLVDAGDRLGNLAQIRALRRGGYAGPFSFEPFAESVQKAPDIAAQLSASMRFIEAKA